ncbi:hypothetical protein V8C86DRAFT_2482310 [Haematococcus lacustris]
MLTKLIPKLANQPSSAQSLPANLPSSPPPAHRRSHSESGSGSHGANHVPDSDVGDSDMDVSVLCGQLWKSHVPPLAPTTATTAIDAHSEAEPQSLTVPSSLGGYLTLSDRCIHSPGLLLRPQCAPQAPYPALLRHRRNYSEGCLELLTGPALDLNLSPHSPTCPATLTAVPHNLPLFTRQATCPAASTAALLGAVGRAAGGSGMGGVGEVDPLPPVSSLVALWEQRSNHSLRAGSHCSMCHLPHAPTPSIRRSLALGAASPRTLCTTSRWLGVTAGCGEAKVEESRLTAVDSVRRVFEQGCANTLGEKRCQTALAPKKIQRVGAAVGDSQEGSSGSSSDSSSGSSCGSTGNSGCSSPPDSPLFQAMAEGCGEVKASLGPATKPSAFTTSPSHAAVAAGLQPSAAFVGVGEGAALPAGAGREGAVEQPPCMAVEPAGREEVGQGRRGRVQQWLGSLRHSPWAVMAGVILLPVLQS